MLDRAHLTYGIVQTPAQSVNDPQLLANEVIVPIESQSEDLKFTVSSPLKLHGVAKVPARRGPDIGEHNDEVLQQLGFDADDIDVLRASGAIPNVWHLEAAASGGAQ